MVQIQESAADRPVLGAAVAALPLLERAEQAVEQPHRKTVAAAVEKPHRERVVAVVQTHRETMASVVAAAVEKPRQ